MNRKFLDGGNITVVGLSSLQVSIFPLAQACSTFYMLLATSAKFSLHVATWNSMCIMEE